MRSATVAGAGLRESSGASPGGEGKCRGREYLRIIYGPEYTLPEHLERLRERRLSLKRSLALCEFALGIEGLEQFVQREPLSRVHECVFGVVALESEPVDPRLYQAGPMTTRVRFRRPDSMTCRSTRRSITWSCCGVGSRRFLRRLRSRSWQREVISERLRDLETDRNSGDSRRSFRSVFEEG